MPPVKKVNPPSQEDIDALISSWDTFAPAKYKGMLSAVPYGVIDNKARWFYDADKRRYITKAGYIVNAKEQRAAWLAYHDALKRRKVMNV